MDSVMKEVDRLELQGKNAGNLTGEVWKMLGVAVGVAVYSVGVNLFLRPLHLYSGGFMGFSQLISTLLRDWLGLRIMDVSGIIYYLLNIPFLVFAFFSVRKRFAVKTVITVSMITVFLTLVPIPKEPILDETIANCLISGILAGFGIGIVLRMGACDGGMDLVGMILIQKKGHYSVGRLNIMANIVLYGVCLLLFDVPVVIYSLIYSVICSLTCDHVHTQNINVQALIITKMEDVSPLEIEIMGQMNRGLTRWDAKGSYTGDDAVILMAVISKYETAQLKSIVHSIDPNAFVMIDEGVLVDGHFLKKIV